MSICRSGGGLTGAACTLEWYELQQGVHSLYHTWRAAAGVDGLSQRLSNMRQFVQQQINALTAKQVAQQLPICTQARTLMTGMLLGNWLLAAVVTPALSEAANSSQDIHSTMAACACSQP